jgi:Fe2+ or Zn2+ uptake regulation protein
MNELLDKLRAAGCKVTLRRKAIIDLFLKKGGVLSPQDVRGFLRESIGQCGLPGIYRNLETMVACGILFRVVTFGGERRYALCNADEPDMHHHHIVCISCGKIGDVSDCMYRDGMKIDGFTLLSHVVQLNGLCDTCAQEQNR